MKEVTELPDQEALITELLMKINFRMLARETYYGTNHEVSGEILRYGYYVGPCPLVVTVNTQKETISLAAQAGNQGQVIVGNSKVLYDDMFASEEPMFLKIVQEWVAEWKKESMNTRGN